MGKLKESTGSPHFVKTREIVNKLNQNIFNGSKVPHSVSMPVLRKVNAEYKICVFIQPKVAEQMRKGLMQRPSHWCMTDMVNGQNIEQCTCRDIDFCTMPYDRLYNKGASEMPASHQDISHLYEQLDDIRATYIKSGIVDDTAYEKYMQTLFEIVPSGQIVFYKELSNVS